MPEPIRPQRWRGFGQGLKLLIVIGLLGGALLYVLSANVEGTLSSVLEGFASALFPLGLVTFVSEYVLKTSFTEELVELTGIQRELYNAGVLTLKEERSIDWDEVIGSSVDLQFIVLRPSLWLQRHWPHVLSAAERKPCSVKVIFVEPDTEAAREAAKRLQIDPTVYSSQIRDAMTNAEESWLRARANHGSPDFPSAIEIYRTETPTSHSLVRADDRTFVLIESIVASSASQSTVCLALRDMDGKSFPDRWVKGGLHDLRRSMPGPSWAKEAGPDSGDSTNDLRGTRRPRVRASSDNDSNPGEPPSPDDNGSTSGGGTG